MKSIRRQFTWILIGLGPGLLAAGFLIIIFFLRHELREQFIDGLKTQAWVIAEEIEEDLEFGNIHELREELKELEDLRVVPRHFGVFREDGSLVTASNGFLSDSREESHLQIPFFPDKMEGFDYQMPDGRPGFAVTILSTDDEKKSTFGVTVMESSSEIEETLSLSFFLVLVVGGCFVLAAFFMVPWLLRSGFRPFDAMREEIESIDSTSLDRQISTQSMPLEFQPFVHRFNELLMRLNTSFERERKVNADLAHEIRNPLAELKLMLEMAIKWPESRSKQLDQELLQTVKMLELMVTRMLELARSESGEIHLHPESVDVGETIRRVLKSVEPDIHARNLRLEVDGNLGVVRSDPVLLESIFKNLLQNAVRYSPEAGTVRLQMFPLDHGRFRLLICNAAPELETEDLKYIMQRYWRKKSAREDQHLGIGTTLVKSFVDALGGRIVYALSNDGILSVEVEIPHAAAEC